MAGSTHHYGRSAALSVMVERLAMSAWVGFRGKQASQDGAQGLADGGIVVHDQDVRKRVTHTDP
jgi:hypothetical protein